MSTVHPLQEIGELLEKAFYAIENMSSPGSFPEIRPERRNAAIDHTWFPGVEVTESLEEYVIRVALAGLDPDELNILFQDRLLILKTRKLARYIESETRQEFEQEVDEANLPEEDIENYGECVYQAPFPANIDAGGVMADFVDDALEIHLPKLKTEVPV